MSRQQTTNDELANPWGDQWRSIFRDQIQEGLTLRKHVFELESEVELLEQALARRKADLARARLDYDLSANLAHEMFDFFKKDLAREIEQVALVDQSTREDA